MLDLRDDKNTEYAIVCNSKKLFKSKLDLFHKAFVPSIKRFGYKIGIQFNRKTSLVAEENNYLAKTLNFYIAYDLDYWLRNRPNNFTL